MEKRQCTATAKRSGKRCIRSPILGGTVCRVHGGAAPQVANAAAGRVAFASAQAAVRQMGFEPVSDPLSYLGQVVGEMAAVKDRLGKIVEGFTTDDDGMLAYDDKGMEQMRAQFTAYTGMLNSLVGALAAMGKLNIDERLSKINENQAGAMVGAFDRALAEVGITGDTARQLRLSLGKHLKAAA